MAMGAGPGKQYLDILVYADAQYVGNPSELMVIKALNYLRNSVELTWSLYFRDPVGFGNALSAGGWNLVIVDHASMPGIGAYWDDLEVWVQAGGALIVSTYDTDGNHTGPTSLWARMGATPAGNIADLLPMNIWENQVFGFPEQPPSQVNFANDYQDEGDSLSVSAGYIAAAGWGYQYSWNNAGVVTGYDLPQCRTLLNSFIVQEAAGDDDSDGIADGAEIYIDEIWYVINCGELGGNEGPLPGLTLGVYPNPFVGSLRIIAPSGAKVSLWDIEGRRLFSGVAEGEMLLETGQLPPGAYILVAGMGNETIRRILVKK